MGRKRPVYLKLLLSFFLCGSLSTSALPEQYRVSALDLGVHDTLPGSLIPDGSAVSITNLHVDPYSKGLIQRDGSTRQNSSQLSGSAEVDVFTYAQQDGDEYLIAFASKTVAYSTDQGATFTTLISTGFDGAYWDCATFVDDKIYCVTQSTSAFNFNGTVHAVTTQTPAAKYYEVYENRMWAANTSANPGRLFFSDLLLASTWTTSTNYIDFDEIVTGLGVINGGLAIYTDNNTYMLRGNDPTNFSVDQISKGIGCANNRTIKNMMLDGLEVQVFLSKGYGQTKNNFYANNGIEVVPIGDAYLETLAGINIGNSSSRSAEWDTEDDFNDGTVDQTTTTYTSGSVILSTANTNVPNNGFESGYNTNWTFGSASGDLEAFSDGCQEGTICPGYSNVTGGQLTATFVDGGGSVLVSSVISAGSAWTQHTLSMSSYRGYYGRIKFNFQGSSYIENDSNFFASGQDITFYARYSLANTELAVDLVENGKTTIASGTYTSEAYQTDSSLSQWGIIDFDYTLNNGSATFYVRTAATSGGLSSAAWTQITDGAQISTTTHQHFQYQVRFASGTSTNLTTGPILNKVTINWVSGSGASQQPSSAVFKENYWMTYPNSSESRNQTVLVINKDGAMYNLEYGTSSQNGFYGLTTSDGGLFAGDSSTDSASGGYVWKLETGSLDNGQAVTSSVQLKHMDFDYAGANSPVDFEKSLQSVYLNYAVQSSGNFTATVYKNFSESSTDYTIPLASGTSVNRWKLEVNQQTTGKQIGLKLTNSTSGQKLKLYPPIIYNFEKVRMIKQQ